MIKPLVALVALCATLGLTAVAGTTMNSSRANTAEPLFQDGLEWDSGVPVGPPY